MKPREQKLVITFQSTTQAMAMEARCREFKKPGRLIPVPREVALGCGLAWCTEIAEREELEDFIRQQGLSVEKLYELML